MTNAHAAGFPGVRPVLRAINSDPKGTMQALASRGSWPAQVTVVISNKTGVDLTDWIDVRVEQGISKAGAEAYMATMGGSTL